MDVAKPAALASNVATRSPQANMVSQDCCSERWSQRSRSWSPPSLTDAATERGEDEDSDDASMFFDKRRLHHPAEDVLDWIIGHEPWHEAETADGQKIRVIGETGALKHLFSLPLRSASEVVYLHRIGDCLVVLDASEEGASSDLENDGTPRRSKHNNTSTAYSPRIAGAPMCQVRVEGDCVRIYPRTAPAEPVDVGPPKATVTPMGTCCEWHVREGLSLLAATPCPSTPLQGQCALADFQNSSPRLLALETWHGGSSNEFSDSCLDVLHNRRPRLPGYHSFAADERSAVLAVNIEKPLETATLVDSWLSCCLLGSPSLLCFFVDTEGICRGVRFVSASEIPSLCQIAQAYRADQPCLSNKSNDSEQGTNLGIPAFDPKAVRKVSHALLDSLVDLCFKDRNQCVAVASPLGLHLLEVPPMEESEDEHDVGQQALALVRSVTLPELVDTATAHSDDVEKASDGTHSPAHKEEKGPQHARVRRASITQALLLYHAAVRLARPRLAKDEPSGVAKGVPTGSRWTAKSCLHPLRVRQMMLRAMRALHAAASTTELGADCSKEQPPPLHRRFLLLQASAFEFLADTFLAEDSHGDDSLNISRTMAALRHLQKSCKHLEEYVKSAEASAKEDEFGQSVRRLEERVLAKRTNAHLCLARLRQRQPWQAGDTSLRTVGLALHELDAAEVLTTQSKRMAQHQRPAGPHESSLLASVAKWKADLLHELSQLCACADGSQGDPDTKVKEYLEAQQREMNESPHPLPAQQERWLQSTISLSLRCLHHLSSVPKEVAEELQLQARSLLARAYGDLGQIYANTGRYTKAMTHAKQGIELFTATKDTLHASKLQVWLSQLQLCLAIPQATSTSLPSSGERLEDSALFRGLPAVSSSEEAACTQVVAALQRTLVGLEGDDAEQGVVMCEAKALLGRVQLRQGLARLARSAVFGAVCRLCEQDTALPSVLELVQTAEQSGVDTAREAIELLLHASSCFRDTGDVHLHGTVHACLAAIYLCAAHDVRMQKLVLTHCQHAMEHLGVTSHCVVNGKQQIARALTLQLMEAKALRRAGGKGSAARTSDARAAAVLCNVALQCQQPAVSSMFLVGATAAAQQSTGEKDDPLKLALLSGDEQQSTLMTYVRQELNEVTLRLLRGYERHEGPGQELKALYCTLLTAWHADSQRAEALVALHDHVRSLAAGSVGS